MNMNQLANSFHLNGYVYIENFFDRNLMDIYQNKILDHFALDSSYKHDSDFIKKSDTDVIPWFPQNDGEKAFDVIEKDERLINLTEAILGPGWKSLYCMVMYSNKSSNGQAWHQDCDPSNSNIFNLNRRHVLSFLIFKTFGEKGFKQLYSIWGIDVFTVRHS